jgi:hypothetical protein
MGVALTDAATASSSDDRSGVNPASGKNGIRRTLRREFVHKASYQH